MDGTPFPSEEVSIVGRSADMFRDLLCSKIYTVMPSHAVVCVWSSLPAAPQTTPVFAEARRRQSFPGAVGANETTYGGNIPSIRPDLA